MLRNLGALGLCAVLLTGCLPDAQKRAQMAEDTEKERDLDVRTVSDVTEVSNVDAMQVFGVGLVTGLAGTGHCPTGYYRDELEQYLLKHSGTAGGEITHTPNELKIRQILESPNNAMVIVSGLIPAGARRGERFDVDITLPPYSKTTSLAGGKLEVTTLRVYQTPANLSNNPKWERSTTPLKGHVFAHAKGALVVGMGDNSDVHELKHARVWQGGVTRIDRPYAFIMRNDTRSLEIADRVAKRINFMFQDDPKSKARHNDFSQQESQLLNMGNVANQLNQRLDPNGMSQGELAKATKECIINVRVPDAYRLDHTRFVLVSMQTPLRDTDPNLAKYQQRLRKMLLDPRDCLRAAVRLEALGRDAIPGLKAGLESDHPFVRFASAEALAYLGSTAGVDALGQLAVQHPILAKHCTIALASLDETVSRDKLAELLGNEEPALRCAAFDALAQLHEDDARLGGTLLNGAYWLYRVPHAARPMVYFSTSKRPQVVLFGRDIKLAEKTRLFVGKNFTVTHDEKECKFYVKNITTEGERQRITSGYLAETLTALAALGAAYPDIVDFLRRASEYQCISCPIVAWSTPDVTLATLKEAGMQMNRGQ